jgi:hypothetical protein
MYEVAMMPDKVGVDPKVQDDLELIAVVREAHGEWDELNVLLRDFATELRKRRLLARVQFVRLIESSRHSKGPCHIGELKKPIHGKSSRLTHGTDPLASILYLAGALL